MISTLRTLILKAFRVCHLSMVMSGLLISPVSYALQIELGTAMRVRTLTDDSLRSVGILAAGSVVEVPDRFKIVNKRTGKVDADATFTNWLNRAGYSKSEINAKVKDPRKDFYFPVHIVSLAKGSSGKNLIGTTRFMALRVLERSQAGLKVVKTSRVYVGPRPAFPLQPTSNPVAAPIARTIPKTKATPRPVPAPMPMPQPQPSQSESEAAPVQPVAPAISESANAEVETETGPATTAPDAAPSASSNLEASSGAVCETCAAASEAASTNPSSAVSEARTSANEIENGANNSGVKGFQGLTKGFPQQCSDFIRADGTYGREGQILLKEIRRWGSDFTSATNMSKACPNFSKFQTPEQKEHFFVWLMTAVFAKESACTADAKNSQATDGVGAGYGQMNEEPWNRNNDFCRGTRAQIYTPALNLKCSVYKLDLLIKSGKGPYYPRNPNYWSTLRSESHGLTKRLISQYAACGAQRPTARKSAAGRTTSHSKVTSKMKAKSQATAKRGRR